MATVAVVLNTTKKLTSDHYSVTLRVIHKRNKKYFAIAALVTNQSLKFRCKIEDFKHPEAEDNGFGKFRKTHQAYKECNTVLETKLKEAVAILKKYDDEGLEFTFEQFEADLKHKEQPLITSLQEYYTQQIIRLDEQGRIGLAGVYDENQRVLKKFRPEAKLTDVNIRFLESFEYWMRNTRNNKDTTISVKMRNLQRVINQAIEDKLFKVDNYPFGEKKYSINKRLNNKTKKIAITLDKIANLKALDLETGSALHLSLQMFLFSYYSRGMNFIDMTYLSWKDISETHINYTRRKTGGIFEVPLNEYNKAILDYYRVHNKVKGDFVFPILNLSIHVTLKQQYTRKKTALKAVNDGLKKIAVLIGDPTLKLTTNVGRHTYATGLKRSGANTSYISEALGHTTEEQTQTYLDSFEKGAIESWEQKMFSK